MRQHVLRPGAVLGFWEGELKSPEQDDRVPVSRCDVCHQQAAMA